MSALGGNLLQELWGTAGMADSVARNESERIESMLRTRNARVMAYRGMLVVVGVFSLVERLMLSLRAE